MAGNPYTVPLPRLPTAPKVAEMASYETALKQWLQDFVSTYNNNQRTLSRELGPVSIIPIVIPDNAAQAASSSAVLFTVNAYLDRDGLLKKTDTASSSWALQFDTQDNTALLLFSPSGTKEITWTIQSVLGSGTGVNSFFVTLNMNGNQIINLADPTTPQGADTQAARDAAIALAQPVYPLPPQQGGTGLFAVAVGDLLYGSAVNTWASLAFDTNGKVLGAVGGLPAWVATTTFTALGTIVTGVWNATVITVPYGGTGTTTLTGILKGTGVTAIAPATHAVDFMDPRDVQNQGVCYATETGAADAYVITLAPAPAAYVEGLAVMFKAINANTGASTLNVNALGVKNLTKRGSTALAAGDILAGEMIQAVYDGTRFQKI